jgi:hypothetical protein
MIVYADSLLPQLGYANFLIYSFQVYHSSRIHFGATGHGGHVHKVKPLNFPQTSPFPPRYTLNPCPRCCRSEALLSIAPSIDFDNKCCNAFSSTIMWQRKLLIGLKALVFILTCVLAIVSSFFTYNVRSSARAARPHSQFHWLFCSPAALAIAFILCTALRSVHAVVMPCVRIHSLQRPVLLAALFLQCSLAVQVQSNRVTLPFKRLPFCTLSCIS